MSADLFGYAPPTPVFKDIRSTRESVAEEKAKLCLTLGELCRRVPSSIQNGSIDKTRAWREDCERARKVLGSKRSSVQDLTAQIAQMRSYE